MGKLKLFRFMESLFSWPAAYFGDRADSIDTDLHDRLREAMKDISERIISHQNHQTSLAHCAKSA